MKNSIQNIVLGVSIFFTLTNLQAMPKFDDSNTTKRDPINYTLILDLSDRVLNSNQLSYDIEQIKTMFGKFKQKAKQNLIITSKDRFIVKIIPQKNSPLDVNYYENALQLRLDQISIKDKNNKLNHLEDQLPVILKKLEKEAKYGKNDYDYAGVDMWLFLKENQDNLAFSAYKNTIVIMTDGYLDFESNVQVMQKENRFTSTRFISRLNSDTWKKDANDKDYGILPISIKNNATWIITGLKSKKPNDLMQLSKLKYFWTQWINESAKTNPFFINYSTRSQIVSELSSIIN